MQTALFEIASPDHDLVGIADVIDRRDLAAGELFSILMGQYLQLELRTIPYLLRLGRSPSTPCRR